MDHPWNNQTGRPVRGKDRRRNDRGSVMLEFIFSFIFFFMVTLVGVMDLGRGIWVHNVMAHASHEAVRYAIVRGADSLSPASVSDIADYLRSRVTFLPADSITVAVEWDAGDNSPGSIVQIEAAHTFQPLLGFILPDISLSSKARMVITN